MDRRRTTSRCSRSMAALEWQWILCSKFRLRVTSICRCPMKTKTTTTASMAEFMHCRVTSSRPVRVMKVDTGYATIADTPGMSSDLNLMCVYMPRKTTNNEACKISSSSPGSLVPKTSKQSLLKISAMRRLLPSMHRDQISTLKNRAMKRSEPTILQLWCRNKQPSSKRQKVDTNVPSQWMLYTTLGSVLQSSTSMEWPDMT
mmetsp:Transcript_9259/g.25958  ORF Transcript_9259/g.25958 Transcript_9259/m.25958 type:complete len:202 (+) Transcript_9259:2331-2936(+)